MFTKLPTVSEQAIKYLKRHRKWVSGGELEDIVRGHKGESTSRILRKMAQDGDIKVDYKKVVPHLRSLVFYRI